MELALLWLLRLGRSFCPLLPHTRPLPATLLQPLGQHLTQPEETQVCQWGGTEPGWSTGTYSVLLLFNAKSASACFLGPCSWRQRLLSSHSCTRQWHCSACGFHCPGSLPFSLYLPTLHAECKHSRDFGTNYHIVHIGSSGFPSSPLGRDERVPLLWPVKPLCSLC